MVPITHAGYLRRAEQNDSLQLNFAVIWNGELTLFPCEDSSLVYPDLDKIVASPEVVSLRGVSAYMPCHPDPDSPGAFTLAGPGDCWKTHFLASSQEDALIWLARFNAGSSPNTSPASARGRYSVLRDELRASSGPPDDTPNIVPSSTLAKWICNAKGPSSERSRLPDDCESDSDARRIATDRLACLEEQLRERQCLLKQLEEQEKQFFRGQTDFRPCRFASTAATPLCLIPGNKSTEVQIGDKVVVYGLQRDFTWRCKVDRTVQAVLSCEKGSKPGCIIMTEDSPSSTDCAMVSAREVCFPLVGALNSLESLSFVSEEANTTLAEARLMELEMENHRKSIASNSAKQGKRKTIVKRLRSNQGTQGSLHVASSISLPPLGKRHSSAARIAQPSSSLSNLSLPMSHNGVNGSVTEGLVRCHSAAPTLEVKSSSSNELRAESPLYSSLGSAYTTSCDSSSSDDDELLSKPSFLASRRSSFRKFFNRSRSPSPKPTVRVRNACSASNTEMTPGDVMLAINEQTAVGASVDKVSSFSTLALSKGEYLAMYTMQFVLFSEPHLYSPQNIDITHGLSRTRSCL